MIKRNKILFLLLFFSPHQISAENIAFDKNLTVKKIAKDLDYNIKKYFDKEKKIYDYIIKDDSIYINFKNKNKNIMSKIDFYSTGENSFSYKGVFFNKLESEDSNINEIMNKFKHFPYSGNINKSNNNYIFDFLMRQEDKINFADNIENSLSLYPYNIKIKVNNDKKDLFWNIDFEKFEINFLDKMYNNHYFISDVSSKGNIHNMDFSIKEISLKYYEKYKIVDLNTIPTEYFLLKNLNILSSSENSKQTKQTIFKQKINVSEILFKNNMMENKKKKFNEIFFDIKYSITDKIPVEEIYKIYNINNIERKDIIKEIFSNPIQANLSFGFIENNFKNYLKLDFSSSKIDIDKINKKSSKTKGILENIKDFKIKIKIELSPIYSHLYKILPEKIKSSVVFNEDSSISLQITEKHFK